MANQKNARIAVSDASTARREAVSTTAVCRASIPYACTVGAPCRTFITCWVRCPAAARSLAYSGPAAGRNRRSPNACTGKTSRKASASRQSSVAKPTKVSTTVTSEVKTPAATRTEVLTSSTSSVTREVTSPVPARSRVAASIRSALSITCSRRSAAMVMPSWSLSAVTPRSAPRTQRGDHQQHHQQAEPGAVAVQHEVDDVAEQQRHDDAGRRWPAPSAAAPPRPACGTAAPGARASPPPGARWRSAARSRAGTSPRPVSDRDRLIAAPPPRSRPAPAARAWRALDHARRRRRNSTRSQRSEQRRAGGDQHGDCGSVLPRIARTGAGAGGCPSAMAFSVTASTAVVGSRSTSTVRSASSARARAIRCR